MVGTYSTKKFSFKIRKVEDMLDVGEHPCTSDNYKIDQRKLYEVVSYHFYENLLILMGSKSYHQRILNKNPTLDSKKGNNLQGICR